MNNIAHFIQFVTAKMISLNNQAMKNKGACNAP